MSMTRFAVWASTFALAVLGGSTASAQFEQLIGRVPKDANALVLVNGGKIFASPAAEKGRWAADREKMYEAGLAFLPPKAEAGLMAAKIDLQLMIPNWELSLFQLDHKATAEDIATFTGGKLDKLVSTPVVATPTDAYIVPLPQNVVGLMIPADRQVTGRWIRDYSSEQPLELSPYLQEAYSFAKDNGTPVIMALDLLDIVAPDHIRDAIVKSEIMKGESDEAIDAAAKTIASVRGVMFGITLKDKMFGKVRVDFGEDAAPLAKHGKQLLLRALARHGAEIDEFANWEAKVSGRQLELEGFLDRSGAMRISMLFHRPVAVSRSQIATSAPRPMKTKEQLVLESSQTYYKKVNDLLRDLKVDSRELTTLGNAALWMDKYANRIDQLPVLNVDEELVQFGSMAANTLRNASGSLRQGLVSAGQASRAVERQYDSYQYGETWGYSMRFGLMGGGMMPWGYSGTAYVPNDYATENLRVRVKTGVTQQTAGNTRVMLQDLGRQSGEIRKKMTMKYGAEF
ncbi:MAG: hypothetical protein U0939_04065 [Pirellulales bacterium]